MVYDSSRSGAACRRTGARFPERASRGADRGRGEARWAGRYHLDRGSRIHRGVRIWVGPGATLALARGGGIGARTVINVESGLTIGTGSQVSWDAQILDTDFHRITGTDGTVLPHTIAVAIGDHVLVGTGALILKGVVIGDGAVVAAGSVVTSSVAAATIVAGNPARAISRLERWD